MTHTFSVHEAYKEKLAGLFALCVDMQNDNVINRRGYIFCQHLDAYALIICNFYFSTQFVYWSFHVISPTRLHGLISTMHEASKEKLAGPFALQHLEKKLEPSTLTLCHFYLST